MRECRQTSQEDRRRWTSCAMAMATNRTSTRLRFRSIRVLVYVLFFFSVSNAPSAQTLFDLTPERQIQFRVDMLRKGIQQEDTCKILMALAPEPCNDGRTAEAAAAVVRQMQAMFEKGAKRKMLLPRPDFPRTDSRLAGSDFWDFDILNPIIDFRNDSATVDCELVLWGGNANHPARGRGLRSDYRFVFVSSPVEIQPVLDSDTLQSLESRRTAATSAMASANWRLSAIDGLLTLLQTGTSDSVLTAEKPGEK